jgi:trehalose 6-phosphate synthase/phosphatase
MVTPPRREESPERSADNIGRLLIVANRLPVTFKTTPAGIDPVPSSGGLAMGLRPWHERSQSVWIGWPGEVIDETATQRDFCDHDLFQRQMVPVHLSRDQVERSYNGFANRVLWPLFHYSIDRVPVDAPGWDAYRDVNEAFADVVMRHYSTNDTIWVHDYQLLLLPMLLRERLPHARIGFFLHIPFPCSEVFRVLPWRREILNGILGADLVGFHTFSYLRHFMTSLLHVDGVETDIDRVRMGSREVRLGVFPMGIDAATFSTLAADPNVRARVETIQREAGGRRIVLGIDRLDYTKGIPRRLEALAQVFERDSELRDGMRYIQIAVPSRGEVDSYQQFRRDVEESVGRINGVYGTLHSLPIHYIHRSVSTHDLVALYCAADVMMVTPLRDGMNLVAKEFAASRVDDDGVLMLSEFAGAATELNGAVTVNPYDIRAVAEGLKRSLSMPLEERRARMRALRRQVVQHDVHAWADAFIRQLRAVRPPQKQGALRTLGRSLYSRLTEVRRNVNVRLLLDYDGTLVRLARSPELAAPDEDLLLLLGQLAATPGIQLDIVSGRSPETLERWFGDLPISLWAEHGFWRRAHSRDAWEASAAVPLDWMLRISPILEQFAQNTPGSHVEVKSASLAWHYRAAPRDFGTRQAHELRLFLGDLLSNQPLEVLEGKKVIEVRLRGVSKAIVAHTVTAEVGSDTSIVAIGDDRTDEELFRALPSCSLTVAVGRPWSAATFHVDDYRAVRRMLRVLLPDVRMVDSPAAGYLREAVSA